MDKFGLGVFELAGQRVGFPALYLISIVVTIGVGKTQFGHSGVTFLTFVAMKSC